MGRNFDDYPGFYPKITPPEHFSRQCTVTFCGKELIYAIVVRSTVRPYTVALNISGRKLTEQATVLAEANTEAMR